jgi:hypothetical protein
MSYVRGRYPAQRESNNRERTSHNGGRTRAVMAWPSPEAYPYAGARYYPQKMFRLPLLFALCMLAGAAPLSARWIADPIIRFVALVVIAAGYAVIALVFDRRTSLKRYSPLAVAFLVLALVQCGNELARGFSLLALQQHPVPGNPLASTVAGTIEVQLLGTLVAIGLILGFTGLFDTERKLNYFGLGRIGVLFVLSIVAFALVAAAMVRHTSRFIPMHQLPPTAYLALLPAVAILAISNGFKRSSSFEASSCAGTRRTSRSGRR